MIKTGEVYTTSTKGEGPYLNHDSRPREVKNPVGIGYALHAAV